jgi:subtilase family serine protease
LSDDVLIIADATNLVTESNEENNTHGHSRLCTAQPQPDLIIEDFQLGSPTTCRITNIGQAWAGSSVVGLIIDGSVVANIAVAPLAPGDSQYINFNHNYTCSGWGDNVEVMADVTLQVTEAKEDNNYQQLLLTCITPVKPDLLIETCNIGSTIYYKITNAGQDVAGPSVTRLIIDGQIAANSTVGFLPPGSTSPWLSFNYNYTCSGLSDDVLIVADGTTLITEGDEGNNVLTNSATCSSQPDLIIDNIKISGSAIFYRIRNAGQVQAGPTWTSLRIDSANVSEDNVGQLGPGEGIWLSFDYAYTYAPPGDFIEVMADGRSEVTESNDANNTRTIQLPIGPNITGISPNSGTQGAVLTGVIISGTNLTGAMAVTFSGTGVTASGLTVNGGGTQITTTITIGGGAAVEPPRVHDIEQSAGLG